MRLSRTYGLRGRSRRTRKFQVPRNPRPRQSVTISQLIIAFTLFVCIAWIANTLVKLESKQDQRRQARPLEARTVHALSDCRRLLDGARQERGEQRTEQYRFTAKEEPEAEHLITAFERCFLRLVRQLAVYMRVCAHALTPLS